ncbi:ThuA domain-containing protein [Clostridium thermarum]|uniref:ThuA domain-containing protein n=1 Tax=Clostridium thermarum TaxID=1716543 RepID=UPI00111D3F8F|nr:ThuA domain-containing protein [Clostridium thermarum]
MKVLVICDDYYHPSSVIKGGLEPLKAQNIEFDFQEDAKEWSEEKMYEYPVIIFTKSNNISSKDTTPWDSEEVQSAFTKYVQQGGGFLAIHSGTSGYADSAKLRALMGGVFTHHPEQCEVTVEIKNNHPIVEGCSNFTIKDEHYFMNFDDSEAEVFINTSSFNGTQPGGWTRTEGKGRVCVLTPGHNLEVWLEPNFQKMLKNALSWCSKEI